MNRRAFLASLVAAPVVASLPDIQRPRFFSGGTLSAVEAFAIDKAARIARETIRTAGEIRALLGNPATPNDMARAMAAAVRGRVTVSAIASEAPPWIRTEVGSREVRRLNWTRAPV
jgi:hypothetical protein